MKRRDFIKTSALAVVTPSVAVFNNEAAAKETYYVTLELTDEERKESIRKALLQVAFAEQLERKPKFLFYMQYKKHYGLQVKSIPIERLFSPNLQVLEHHCFLPVLTDED